MESRIVSLDSRARVHGIFNRIASSGKSTLANALSLKLREITDRPITFLDGDVIRTHLSHGLGFSQEDRETNITRVGFVAKEITRHGGIVICALVAPFARARNIVREMISETGGYIEAYVSTPLDVCEKRDRKGMHKKAREGVIRQFTGISDAYEVPEAPEITIDTVNAGPADIIEYEAVKNEFYDLYPLYQYANLILKENLQIEREIRTIRKSWLWKLLTPLCWLDDYLRQQRQRGRLHKRLTKAYG